MKIIQFNQKMNILRCRVFLICFYIIIYIDTSNLVKSPGLINEKVENMSINSLAKYDKPEPSVLSFFLMF